MRHINKTKLLIILFTPLVLWFLYFLIVDIYDTIFNHYRITNFINRVEDKINRKFAKPKIAKVICDNCGIKEIYLDYPYSKGYYLQETGVFHCIEKYETDDFTRYCTKVEQADQKTLIIVNENFAYDKNNIYCKEKIVNNYHSQNIKASPGELAGEINDYRAEDEEYNYSVDYKDCKVKKEPSTTK